MTAGKVYVLDRCPSYKESKKTTVQRQGPTLGICLREELYLPWMFAMVKEKVDCLYLYNNSGKRSLIQFNLFIDCFQ